MPLNTDDLIRSLLKNTELIATVVDNVDPGVSGDKYGRVKIRVPRLHDDTKDADLPWALPKIASDTRLEIPKKGSRVWVTFISGDPASPQYAGNVFSKIEGKFSENYPNTRGIYDGKNWIVINSETNTIEINNPEASIELTDSDINISANGQVNVSATDVNVEGTNVNIDATGQVNIQAPIIRNN